MVDRDGYADGGRPRPVRLRRSRALEPRRLRMMLVAGEASGDVLGARPGARRCASDWAKRRALRRRRRRGDGARRGSRAPSTSPRLSVVGLFEGLAAYPRIVRRADETARLAAAEKPDIAVLIDSWGFTLRVARRLRRQNPDLPLIKYVGPQVWATRPGRAKTLARTLDRLLAIHGFEAPYFEAAGMPTTFVGNPRSARDFCGADPVAAARARSAPDRTSRILLVLPGSRPSEIERLLPPFEDAVAAPGGRSTRTCAWSRPPPRRWPSSVRAKLATWRTRVARRRGRDAQARRHAGRDGRARLQRHGDHRAGAWPAARWSSPTAWPR